MNKRQHVKDIIGAYIYGDLPPEEMRQVREHLDACEPCREDAESQARAIACIPDEGRVLLEVDRQRVRWSVLGAVKRERSERVRRPLVRRFVWGFSAAGALVCMFLIGLFVGAQQLRPAEGPRPGSDLARPPYKPAPTPVKPPIVVRKPSGYVARVPGTAVKPARDALDSRFRGNDSGRRSDRGRGNDSGRRSHRPKPSVVPPAPASAPAEANYVTPPKITLTASAEWHSPVGQPVHAALPVSKDDARPAAPPSEESR